MAPVPIMRPSSDMADVDASVPDGTREGDRCLVLAASARGFHHVRQNLANQDAWAHGDTRTGATAVAIADGHGHDRHFRSAKGAALAVEVARRDAIGWATSRRSLVAPGSGASAAVVSEALRVGLLPRIWRDWRAAVEQDLGAEPFSAAEEAARQDDDRVMAYGATLLLAVVVGDWVLLGQIGDGDVVAVTAEGASSCPVPSDSTLDGQRTTSLCQPDAIDAFRVAVIDRRTFPLKLLLLATDGYGNAQIDDPWQPGVGRDLIALLAEQGAAWVGEQLPGWVQRCASAEGSGDDTTMALAVMADPARPRLGSPSRRTRKDR
jgi:hypothetical protein